jgi:hypothetical protein
VIDLTPAYSPISAQSAPAVDGRFNSGLFANQCSKRTRGACLSQLGAMSESTDLQKKRKENFARQPHYTKEAFAHCVRQGGESSDMRGAPKNRARRKKT